MIGFFSEYLFLSNVVFCRWNL